MLYSMPPSAHTCVPAIHFLFALLLIIFHPSSSLCASSCLFPCLSLSSTFLSVLSCFLPCLFSWYPSAFLPLPLCPSIPPSPILSLLSPPWQPFSGSVSTCPALCFYGWGCPFPLSFLRICPRFFLCLAATTFVFPAVLPSSSLRSSPCPVPCLPCSPLLSMSTLSFLFLSPSPPAAPCNVLPTAVNGAGASRGTGNAQRSAARCCHPLANASTAAAGGTQAQWHRPADLDYDTRGSMRNITSAVDMRSTAPSDEHAQLRPRRACAVADWRVRSAAPFPTARSTPRGMRTGTSPGSIRRRSAG
ncbi:uncharacterized protein LOC110405929 [Numida meleagris]|uniref:uncharacterized protein LOC110405929 n=1 Tax=Numida meleagris TaxID=8996 RepID=UPI000B3DD7B8|nr:uncharacterized protein LOC110405929 [Numida meleagris]XP_021267449.1 uncharacterized protein LOC110405929 [Numida meleagris]